MIGPPCIAQDAIVMAEHATQHTTSANRVRSFEILCALTKNRAPARGDERDGVLSLRGHGQRRVVRDSATCVVRAIDGDRGGARDSSRLITVCCVSPPLRSAFLQLMTLRSTSSNPYHFSTFFPSVFFFRGPRPLLRRAPLGAAARTRRRLIGSLPRRSP